jgi:1-acyl-sn-glycerol-3-phosphate acyltransferase
MRLVKLAAIVSLWTSYFGFVAFAHLWISVLRLPNRWVIISRLTCSLTFLLRAILNIKVTVVGDVGQLERSGTVIISNHLGYIDGFVLGSLFPVVFVSKREVKNWPVIGLWTSLCGTIFINRQRKNQVASLVTE